MNATAQDCTASHAAIVADCFRVLQDRGVFCFGRYATTTKGISDIVGVTRGGKFLAVEVQTGGSVPTADQRDFLNAVKRRGGIALVVYDSSDLADIIDRAMARAA